jgi:hypothetical protein
VLTNLCRIWSLQLSSRFLIGKVQCGVSIIVYWAGRLSGVSWASTRVHKYLGHNCVQLSTTLSLFPSD